MIFFKNQIMFYNANNFNLQPLVKHDYNDNCMYILMGCTIVCGVRRLTFIAKP